MGDVVILVELMVFDCDEERVGSLVLIGGSPINELDNANDADDANADEDEWRSGLRR